MTDKDLAKLIILSEANLFSSSVEELEEFEKLRNSSVSEQATKTRDLLNKTIKSFKKQKLANIRKELNSKIQKKVARSISKTIGNKKEFLQSILDKFPTYSDALTFQNRDLSALSDEDIELALEQLEELGVIDDFLNKNE